MFLCYSRTGSSFFFCTNKRKTEAKRKFAGYVPKLFRSSREGSSFLFHEEKKRKQRKFAGYVPEAKICTFFLKKKNSLTLKQLFLFNEKTHKFLHASPLMPDASGVDVYLNVASLVFRELLRTTSEAMLRQSSGLIFFGVKWRRLL